MHVTTFAPKSILAAVQCLFMRTYDRMAAAIRDINPRRSHAFIALVGALILASWASVSALEYPYTPYNKGRMDPQLTGWPLDADQLAWLASSTYKRPGNEPGGSGHSNWLAYGPMTPLTVDGQYVVDRHAASIDVADKYRDAHGSKVDILLVGDSITEQWDVSSSTIYPQRFRKPWTDVFGAYSAFNIGFGGEKTYGILWRLDHLGGVGTRSPGLDYRLVILAIGHNNMYSTPETGTLNAAKGIQWCVKSIREKFPNADVIVCKVLPNTWTDARTTKPLFYTDAQAINAALDGLNLEEDPKVHLLPDMWNDMTNGDGTLRTELFDMVNSPVGVHLSDLGYDKWAAKLKPLVDEILSRPLTSPLKIASSPSNRTVASGVSASFRVTVAGGVAPLTYKWQRSADGSTWTDIVGATSSRYAISTTSGDHGAQFRAVVTDAAANSVTSNAAKLSTMTITTQPANTSVAVGNRGTFRVVATGSPALTYRWMRNGGSIFVGDEPTAATSTYETKATTAADNNATFSVALMNSEWGTVTSTVATLTVLAANRAPTVANVIPAQTATVGTAFSYVIPANTFADADSDVLTLSVTGLPSWATFTVGTRTISGTPTTAAAAVTAVVTANDGRGGTVLTNLSLTVSAANRAPTVANVIPAQSATVGTAYSYVIPANTFADADSDVLTLSVTGLPSWARFSVGTRTISGTPTTAAEAVTAVVTANDGRGGTVSTNLSLTVSATSTDVISFPNPESVSGCGAGGLGGLGMAILASLTVRKRVRRTRE